MLVNLSKLIKIKLIVILYNTLYLLVMLDLKYNNLLNGDEQFGFYKGCISLPKD